MIMLERLALVSLHLGKEAKQETDISKFENSIDTNMNVYTLSLRYSLLS